MDRPSSLRRTVLSGLAGTGLLVAGAFAAGTAAAGPAAVVPTVTVPTVTVPAVPTVTTVTPPPLPPPPRPPVVTAPPPPRPVPTPPAVTTAARVVQVPSPPVTTPAPVRSERVPTRAASAPAAPAPSASPQATQPAARSTSAPSSSSQPSSQSKDPPPGSAGSGVFVLQTSSAVRGEYPRVKLTKLRPGRPRFANRGKKRGATVISFELSRQVQIVIAVKGPGPSCERVGRGQILGRAGLNRIRFDGTVRKVPLKPGMYRLDARLKAGGRLLGSTYVTIIDPRTPFKRYARPDCSPAKLAPVAPVSGLREVVTFTQIPATVPRKSSEPAKPKAVVTRSRYRDQAEVLGKLSPPLVGGAPIDVTDGGSRSVLELLLIAIVGGSVLALLVALYVSVRRGRSLI